MKPMNLLSVFVHEFGHASACFLTGGKLDSIEVCAYEAMLLFVFFIVFKIMTESHFNSESISQTAMKAASLNTEAVGSVW